MGRFPTRESLGPRPTPRSQRKIVPIRAGIAESAAAAGFRSDAEIFAAITDVSTNLTHQFAKEDSEREARDLNVEYANAVRLLQRGDGTDANPGYLNLKGENAINAREGHLQALEKLNETMLGKASSPRVSGLVVNAFQSRFGTALDSSVRHFGVQRVAANKASHTALQASIADDAAELGAAGDSEGVAGAAKLAGAQAAAFALQTGADPKFEAEAAETKIHIAEIRRLAVTDASGARAYFDKHRADIDGREHNGIGTMLERAERQAEKDAEKAEKAAEKRLNEAQELRAAQLTDGIIERRTTDAELDTARDNREIDGGQFIAARKLLRSLEKEDAATDNQNVVKSFTEQVETGTLTTDQVIDAFANKLVTRATMDRFRTEIDGTPDDFRTKEQRRMLRENVGGVSGLGAILGEKATRKVNDAIQEFNERVRGPEKEDPRAVRVDIESRATEPRGLESLFRPRFMIGPDKETMDIQETKKASLKAFRAKRITRAQLAREISLIRQIEAARQ